jgi:hypothetical protein
VDVLNPDRMYQFFNDDVPEEIYHDNILKKLFWDITENWKCEQDVDYSVPLEEIVAMVEQSPRYFREKMGTQDVGMEICESLLQAKRIAGSRRRVL